jgi:hypothetical protein
VDDRIRTSDADRERVTARLREHYAEGRLTRDELDERIAAALNARTFGDLRRVLADLPEPSPIAQAARPPWAVGWPHPVVVRRGPRLLPLMALILFALVLIPSAGAAAVLLKVAAVALTFMFVFLIVSALMAARFVRRARKHWYFDHIRQHAGNWHADW